MADPTRRRTIFADSGNMRMSKGMTDLELTLYNGNMQDVPVANPDELQRLYFNVDLVRVRGVGNQFEKSTSDAYKSDREMTVCEMQQAQDKARLEHDIARKEFEVKRAQLRTMKAKPSPEVLNAKTSPPWDVGLGRLYCNAVSWIKPKAAHAQTLHSNAPGARTTQAGSSTATAISSSAQMTRPAPSRLSGAQLPDSGMSEAARREGSEAATIAGLEALRIRLSDSSQLMNSYGVEIHKKFALAVACFVFVLLGAPIALRFPRGGVGLTIGVSLFVFALYYVCLIAGESIAKRGLMPAVVSMWMANVIFAMVALWMLARMGQEGSTARGGDMREFFDSIRGAMRSKAGWKNRRVRRDGFAA
jgi:lipopolysaccharide export system permease protein